MAELTEEPATGAPETGAPAARASDAGGADAPASDARAAEARGSDAPGAEAPGADAKGSAWVYTLEADERAPGAPRPLLADHYVIGRDEACGVRIDERNVSRRHAELVRAGAGGWHVRDLGRANGTFVNGERLGAEARALAAGDCVQVGDALLTFRPEVAEQHAPSVFTSRSGRARPAAAAYARLLLLRGREAARVIRLDRGPVTLGGGAGANARLEGAELAGVEVLVRPLPGGWHEAVNRGAGRLCVSLLPVPYARLWDGDLLFVENDAGEVVLRLRYVGAGRRERGEASASSPPVALAPPASPPSLGEASAAASPPSLGEASAAAAPPSLGAAPPARRGRRALAGAAAVTALGLLGLALRQGATDAGPGPGAPTGLAGAPSRPDYASWSSEAPAGGAAGADAVAEAHGAAGAKEAGGEAGRRAAARPVRAVRAGAAGAQEAEDVRLTTPQGDGDADLQTRLEARVFSGRANAAEVRKLRDLCERQRDVGCRKRLQPFLTNDVRDL